MIVELVKSEGIAHHSYFVGNSGRAAVVDPRRDVEVYLSLAESNGLDITHIFETHRNEDYVIGSLELADATGAEIYHGRNLDFGYGTPVIDGAKFTLGSVELEVLETPGHTLESISLALRDMGVSKEVQMVFSGDVIFAGETGRVDFYGVDRRPEMAGLLYDSLFSKILPLGDHVILCPAHGAGSVCGADIRQQDYTTVGYEMKTNPQLNLASKKDFIDFKIKETLYTPPYFKKMEEYNQKGAPIMGRLPYLKAMPAKILKKMQSDGAQILDVRKPTSFGDGHIPGSFNIWREGVAAFAGWFLNYNDPIILVDDHGYGLNEVRQSLVRLGFDNIYGYLADGFPNWYLHAESVDKLNLWTVQDLKKHQFDGDFFLLDVRQIDDWENGYIEGAYHIYLGEVPLKMNEIPGDTPVVVYCDSGYKSTVACSFLKNNGYSSLTSVVGSMTAWKKAGYPVVND
ncbi:MBL fold metallo-hydrolase [Methanobacterium petrolearium]|uniref:MBL fold metallo-hydrolase n=1 Tax=Methanobacterium petrolearium TaxID=710190 RepID=UPI001FD8136A|nr:MBL fold metallo-hydrolase [Methanobacterium petrolearium]MBP1945873.1 hydroxyacylglutathione hydrolase [Methanobacterium petrolearium]BDZ69575.1 MBL fold hydrolase [Methanobacterium petrolearium]